MTTGDEEIRPTGWIRAAKDKPLWMEFAADRGLPVKLIFYYVTKGHAMNVPFRFENIPLHHGMGQHRFEDADFY